MRVSPTPWSGLATGAVPDEMTGDHARNTDGTVHLIGLDFGSTTSSALVARTRIGSRSATGRMSLETPDVVYRPSPVFTPFRGDAIDEDGVIALLDLWIDGSGVAADGFFAGGTIITGLAARSSNAGTIARLVGARIGEAVVATADDPCLESWLAFMGSCSTMSRFHASVPIVNLDIGGGTTNAALGRDGNVTETGCHFIGARHFQVRPGSYALTAISEYGRALLHELRLERDVGEDLTPADRTAILDWYVQALEAIVRGDDAFFATEAGRLHEQVRFRGAPEAAITFSGGVGELLYRHVAGEALPDTTHFGDLGIDLALRIAESPLLSRDLRSMVPEHRGRATVYGLALHSTEVSGSTLFLPRPEILPLRDLPVVARLRVDADEASIREAVLLAGRRPQGACIQIVGGRSGRERVKELGLRLGAALRDAPAAFGCPLVLLTEANLGKTIGNYATDWDRSPMNLIVVDEMPDRHAHFANLGRPRDGIVPVSFYGMH